MNWEMTIPIIVALVTSGISYFAARSKNKTELDKVKLILEKDLEMAREKHEQELIRLEREMEMKSKSKEEDIINDLTGEAFKGLLGEGFFQTMIKEAVKKEK